MKKYYKKFTSKKAMVASLLSLTEEFNTDKSIELLKKAGPRRLYLSPAKGGKVIACDNFKKFTRVLHDVGGLELHYPLCFGRGEVYHVFTKVDYFNTSKLVGVGTAGDQSNEDDTQPSEKAVVLSHYAPVLAPKNVDLTEEEKEEEVVVEEEVVEVPDWEWVDGLENNKDNKLALDQYAEKFGISLKRNKSLSNMIRDFKKEYKG